MPESGALPAVAQRSTIALAGGLAHDRQVMADEDAGSVAPVTDVGEQVRDLGPARHDEGGAVGYRWLPSPHWLREMPCGPCADGHRA